jgi:hypothetical protein
MIYKIIILIVIVYILFRYYVISENYVSSLLIENITGSVSLGNITGPMITNGSIPVINMAIACSEPIYYGLDNNNIIMVSPNNSRYYQIQGTAPAASSITNELITSTYWPLSLPAPGSSKYKYVSLTTYVPPNNLGSIYGELVPGNVPVSGSVTVGTDTVYYTRTGMFVLMVGMPSGISKYHMVTPSEPAIPTDIFITNIFPKSPSPNIHYQYTTLAPLILIPGNKSPTSLGTITEYGIDYPVINSVLIDDNPVYYSLNSPVLRMIDPILNLGKEYIYRGTNETITVNDSDVIDKWGTSGPRYGSDVYIFTPTPLTIVPGTTPAVNLGTFSGSSLIDNTTIPVINSVTSGSDTVYYAFNENIVVMVSTTGTIKCNTITGDGIKPISNSDVIGFWSSAPSDTGYKYNRPPANPKAANVSTTNLGTIYGSIILCAKAIVNKVTVDSETIFYTLSDNHVIMINKPGTIAKYYTFTSPTSVSVNNSDVISYWTNANELSNVKITLIEPSLSVISPSRSSQSPSSPPPQVPSASAAGNLTSSNNSSTYIIIGVVISLAVLGGGAYFAISSERVSLPKKSSRGGEYYYYDIGT